MLGFFILFVLQRLGIGLVLYYGCGVGIEILVCYTIGVILEFIVAFFMSEVTDLSFVKEIIYYLGLLLETIPLFVLTFQNLSLFNSDLNYWMASILAMVSVQNVCCWFGNAYEGKGSFTYGLSGVAVSAIVMAVLMPLLGRNFHTLSIVSLVIGFVSIVIMVVARLKLGSNMD